MAAIARACFERRINAEIRVVVSDRASAAGIAVAHEMGIDARAVPRSAFADQDSFELALGAAIDSHAPDLIVLAGFMRILSPVFVERYAGRMLNVHPALLPKYRGLHTHRRALEAGDAQHGASVHFVTPELDGGPVVLQSRVSVEPGDTEMTLSARVQATEHIIYPRVIGWIADGRLSWSGGLPYFDGKPLHAPVVEDLSAEAHQ
jgi:phosphoribosylglycinamide formyltransferase-1